jgi:hypothetical protein
MRDPGLEAALPVAQGFAARHGLCAEAVDHWEQYIDIHDAGGQVDRRLLVFAPVLPTPRVVAVGIGSSAEGQRIEVRRSFGEGVWQEAWQESLRLALEDGWQWLRSLNEESVRQADEDRREHLACRLLPVILRFAFSRGLDVRELHQDHCTLAWPTGGAEFALQVSYSPDSGIVLDAYRAVRRGVLKKRVWLLCSDLLSDLRTPDWVRVDEFADRLRVAEQRTAACDPPPGSPEVWMG